MVSTLRQIFEDKNNDATFGLRVENDFSTLPKKAMGISLEFVTFFLCYVRLVFLHEQSLKRSVEKKHRTAISSIKPPFGKICSEKQAQPVYGSLSKLNLKL